MGCRSPRPQRLSTRRHVHQTTTTLRGYYSLSRVLTFYYAGFRQRSLSSRRFGLPLRGGSGLLSGRRGFFFRHRCRGFIPLPGEIRQFPAEYTSRLSIKYDYHIKYYSGRFNTYKLDRTTVTVGAPRMLAMSTSPTSAGASSCASVAAASSAVTAAGVALSCASAATTSSAQQLRVPCSPEEQGAGAPSVPGVLRQWGLGCDSSGFPHRVPLAFVSLINGLRRRQLLQARKLVH
jgi:hypothetical protein